MLTGVKMVAFYEQEPPSVKSTNRECGFNYTLNVKSSMANSLPVENLLPQNVGSIINYLQ